MQGVWGKGRPTSQADMWEGGLARAQHGKDVPARAVVSEVAGAHLGILGAS